MIAIDTNVLLRHLLQDEADQAQRATVLIAGADPVLVTDIVLVEMVWVLTGKRYRLDRDRVAGVVSALLAEPNIVFEDGQTVWRALNDYRKARPVKVGSKKKAPTSRTPSLRTKPCIKPLSGIKNLSASTLLMSRLVRFPVG